MQQISSNYAIKYYSDQHDRLLLQKRDHTDIWSSVGVRVRLHPSVMVEDYTDYFISKYPRCPLYL